MRCGLITLDPSTSASSTRSAWINSIAVNVGFAIFVPPHLHSKGKSGDRRPERTTASRPGHDGGAAEAIAERLSNASKRQQFELNLSDCQLLSAESGMGGSDGSETAEKAGSSPGLWR
jgi:hypothetical protein